MVAPELSDAIGYSKQQFACLAALPIEVMEYQPVKCLCNECGAIVIGSPASGIVRGQDLSIDLQALLSWLGNYGQISYSKQQEFLCKLGRCNCFREFKYLNIHGMMRRSPAKINEKTGRFLNALLSLQKNKNCSQLMKLILNGQSADRKLIETHTLISNGESLSV